MSILSVCSPRRAFPRRRTYSLAAFAALCGLLLAAPAFAAEIKLTLDQKDGEKVSDIVKIAARAESEDGIDKVEFKLDDQEPFVDTSTPYEYEWDTTRQTVKEGAHTLSVTAFDANGKTKRVAISLEVDNQLAEGGEALAQKGLEALAGKEYDTAIKFGRRALKADPVNLSAARVVAAVYGARADWPKAIAALDKQEKLETSADAMRELASYRMRRALIPENTANFFAELVEIDTLRRKAVALDVQETTRRNTPASGKPTAQNIEAIGDALLNAGRFHEAALEYGKAATADEAAQSLINRYALALTLDNRPMEAISYLKPLVRAKKSDAATRAVYGLALLRSQQFAAARDMVKADVADQFPAALILSAYAESSLGNAKEAAAQAKDAVALVPNAGDAHYAQALALSTLRDNKNSIDSDNANARALSLAPFQSGPYLDYATRLLALRRQDRYDQALNLTDFVLKYEPEHIGAKMMQAMVYLQTNRAAEAEPVLTFLKNKEGKAPDVLMALAVYWNVKGNGGLTTQYMAAARKADPERFDPNTPEAPMQYLFNMNRKLQYRVSPFLTLSSLYPDRAGAVSAL